MMRTIAALLAGVFVCVVFGCATAASAGASGQITIRWASLSDRPNTNGVFHVRNRLAARALKRSGQMEQLAQKVSRQFSLPNDIPVFVSDELSGGPAYGINETFRDLTGNFIVFPGRTLRLDRADVRRELRAVRGLDADRAFVASQAFLFAHELGHALVHQLDLPVTGREEDAVDGFAFYLLRDDPRFGPLAAFSTAALFDRLARRRGQAKHPDFADEHSLFEQRVVHFLCWTYGSNPRQFRSLIGKHALPRRRARSCPREFRQLARSWDRLMQPHLASSAGVTATG